MSSIEKRTYIGGAVFAVAFITASALVLKLPVRAEKALLTDFVAEADNFTAETAKPSETGQIRSNSGMPCENPEQFGRWYATYEQETSEEDAEKPNINTDCCEDVQTEIPTELPTEVETTVEVPSEPVEETVAVYSVNGETLNPELQALMYDALTRHGIGYWYELGLCQMYQESGGNIYAENVNGQDKGVLQYRIQFWDWSRGDIFNPAAQIELYAEQMAQRLNSGLSADECISRHKTSDYSTAVDWEYVAQVKQHLSTMRGANQ